MAGKKLTFYRRALWSLPSRTLMQASVVYFIEHWKVAIIWILWILRRATSEVFSYAKYLCVIYVSFPTSYMYRSIHYHHPFLFDRNFWKCLFFRYKEAFTKLKSLKTEIEHLQHLLEKSKVQMQKDFEIWWTETASIHSQVWLCFLFIL